GSVRKNNTRVRLKVGFLNFASFKQLLNALTVLRMLSAEIHFSDGAILVRREAEYSIKFRRHYDSPRWNIMSPATSVSQPLPFKKRFFAAAQLVFCALPLGDVTADRGQSETASTSFIRDEKHVLPHWYGCTSLKMSKERLAFPAAVLEDRWQDIPIESLQILLRYVVGDLGSTHLFVPR